MYVFELKNLLNEREKTIFHLNRLYIFIRDYKRTDGLTTKEVMEKSVFIKAASEDLKLIKKQITTMNTMLYVLKKEMKKMSQK